MNKSEYKKIKDIKILIAKGKHTTFAERNIVKIYDKRMAKKQRDAKEVNYKVHIG